MTMEPRATPAPDAAEKVRDVMTFTRAIRYDDGMMATCVFRTNGGYYLILADGEKRAERIISKDAAHGCFEQALQIRAVLHAIEELKLELRAREWQVARVPKVPRSPQIY
jgi:hypothetical protein